MKLSTIIRQARRGELSGASEKDKTDEAIVDYTNRALIALYNRFQLRTEEAIINLVDGKTVYSLDGTDPDVVIPTDVEIISFVEAFDESGEIPINVDNREKSIFTVGYNRIQIPLTATGNAISVLYRSSAPEVEYEIIDGVTVDKSVPLPNSLLDAVLLYIGYVAHRSFDEASQANSLSYLKQYELACNEAEEFGLIPSDTFARDVEVKGFL